MFSSLASFLFGSNTSDTRNRTTTENPSEQANTKQEHQQQQEFADDEGNVGIDAYNIIEVTSSTPSVAGANVVRLNKRGKNRRTKYNKLNKKGANGKGQQQKTTTPTITKLLTPTDSIDEDFDEDEWYIVEKEDEEDSLPRTDSEEELAIDDVKPTAAKVILPIEKDNTIQKDEQQKIESEKLESQQRRTQKLQAQQIQQRRRQQNITSHSYSGPRPQQKRNLQQRIRSSGARSGDPNFPQLSPPKLEDDAIVGVYPALADVGLTQSLYVRSSYADVHNNSGVLCNPNMLMDESWFVTPPPCFTSIGPINMQISPYENLLIEHPSMSVYYSIRNAQEATESFVNLDLGVGETQQQNIMPAVQQSNKKRRNQAAQQRPRSANVRFDRYMNDQLKQEVCAHNAQKQQVKQERQNISRGAIKRSNKARDIQSKGNRQRRSDLQGYRVVSGANNNRKCN